MDLNMAKSFFFDRHDWLKVLYPAEFKALNRVGWILMKQARSLIKKRKKPSRKGSTPTNWTDILRDKPGIVYGVDPHDLSVHIGPVKVRTKGTVYKTLSQPTVPAILQFGGKVWNRFPTTTRRGNRLPGPRTVRVEPRPYMDKAYKQKEKKVMDTFENMVGKTPESIMIAENIGRSRKGSRRL